MSDLKVLSVASEIFPLVKTGGLGDVVGALPRALQAEAIDMRVLVPGYPAVMAKLGAAETVLDFDDLFGGSVRVLAARFEGLSLFVVEAPHLYDRPGGPYQSALGRDWPDNAERFAALGWVARAFGSGAISAWRPAIVHAHDWQAALAPTYLALTGQNRPATVITIHNVAFQGQFPAAMLSRLRLPESAFAADGVEYYGAIGFLKAGLFYADAITTVSPTYAREIQTPESGMGLDGLLRHRADRLIGIVNGIDEAIWDPASDLHLAARYGRRRLGPRRHNRVALQQRFGLDHHPGPLFAVISRLTWQKGMDLLLEALPGLIAGGGQLVLLGAGDATLEAAFADAARGHAGRVGCDFGYDEPLAHLIQGGADALLMPSRFEPCGLTQLYGLRYGAVPIVARVGGLADTIIDANDAALADRVATGFQFAPVRVDALTDAIARAQTAFHNRAAWRAMQRRGMSRKLGWSARAPAYAALYRRLIAEGDRPKNRAEGDRPKNRAGDSI